MKEHYMCRVHLYSLKFNKKLCMSSDSYKNLFCSLEIKLLFSFLDQLKERQIDHFFFCNIGDVLPQLSLSLPLCFFKIKDLQRQLKLDIIIFSLIFCLVFSLSLFSFQPLAPCPTSVESMEIFQQHCKVGCLSQLVIYTCLITQRLSCINAELRINTLGSTNKVLE